MQPNSVVVPPPTLNQDHLCDADGADRVDDRRSLSAASANVMSRLSSIGGERRVVALATAASRLSRAFHDALEKYHRIKRGNTQVIQVEKLEVQPGGQALVGTLQRG